MPIKFDEHNPTTLNEAVDILYDSLNSDEFEFVQTNGISALHHGYGTAIRNNWGLWHDSQLSEHFKTTYGLGHADDMSGLILEGLLAKVDGRLARIDEKVESYKAHWRKYNVDPLTQQQI